MSLADADSALTDEQRRWIGQRAVDAVQGMGYRSVGTFEFLFEDGEFFFIEMNTRLQVEHPVTELVTGLDLVEQMIRVTAGEKLPIEQKDVGFSGWAIETRVYAEDPLRGFLPSIGRLQYYDEPAEAEGVRIDTGVVEGSEISMYYDPMIAKLCTHADTRDRAIERMQHALDAYYIRGINHNMAFLADVMAKPRFQSGELSTNFIDEEYPDGFLGTQPTETVKQRVVIVAAILQRAAAGREAEIVGQMSGHGARVGNDWEVFLEDDRIPVTVTPGGQGRWRVATPQGEVEVQTDWTHGAPLFHASISGRPVTVQVGRALAPDPRRGQRGGARPAPARGQARRPDAAEGAAGLLQVPALADAGPAGQAAGRGGHAGEGGRGARRRRGDEDGERPARRTRRHGRQGPRPGRREPRRRPGDPGVRVERKFTTEDAEGAEETTPSRNSDRLLCELCASVVRSFLACGAMGAEGVYP